MRVLFFVLAVSCALGSVQSLAQSLPDKPLRLVVGSPPGGSTDILGRIIAARLSNVINQPIVVENRPGAAGNLATGLVAKGVPDGSTLLLGSTGTNAVNPNLYSELPFDVLKDLTPVTLVATGANVLAIHANLSAHDVVELIALAKAHPGKYTYASAGVGSSMHLQAELFERMAGVNLLHVPYKGATPAMNDLLAGRVDMAFVALVSALPFAQQGKLRLLGITSAQRSRFSPDTPTIAEAALPGYDMSTWYGLFITAGSPSATVQRLHREWQKLANLKDVEDDLGRAGFEVASSTSPEEFQAFQVKELGKWGHLVKSIGVKLQ